MVRLTLSADNLPKMDRIGWCDPFVKFYINDVLKHITDTFSDTTSCTWETFNLKKISCSDILKFEVFDYDDDSENDLIGISEIKFSELKESSEKTFNLQEGGTLNVQMTSYHSKVSVTLSDIADTDGLFNKPDIYYKVFIKHAYDSDVTIEHDSGEWSNSTANLDMIHQSEVKCGATFVYYDPFNLSYESRSDRLIIEIYDQDTITSDDFLGQSTFTMKSITHDGVEHNSIHDKNGNLMCNVIMRTVNSNRKNRMGRNQVKNEESVESKQKTYFQGSCQSRRGGFFGKILVTDSYLGDAGKFLSNVHFAGYDREEIFVAENCIFTRSADKRRIGQKIVSPLSDLKTAIFKNDDHEDNDEYAVQSVLLFDQNFKCKLKSKKVYCENLDREMKIKFDSKGEAEAFYEQVLALSSRDQVGLSKEELKNKGRSFALPREESLCKWFVLGFGRGNFRSEKLHT